MFAAYLWTDLSIPENVTPSLGSPPIMEFRSPQIHDVSPVYGPLIGLLIGHQPHFWNTSQKSPILLQHGPRDVTPCTLTGSHNARASQVRTFPHPFAAARQAPRPVDSASILLPVRRKPFLGGPIPSRN